MQEPVSQRGLSAAGTAPRHRQRAASARGSQTRERLLDAAERLWGQRGVEGVSLREIRLAAGQRNSSALQFHFGGRRGLLLALTQRHLPRVASAQEDLHRAVVADGRQDDLTALTEVLVRPDAEYLRRGPSERAWIKISAELLARPETMLGDIAAHAPPPAVLVGKQIYEQLARMVEPDVAVERLLSVLVAVRHLCAARARLEDASPGGVGRSVLPFDRWLANLLDMAVAALGAPPRTLTDPRRTDG